MTEYCDETNSISFLENQRNDSKGLDLLTVRLKEKLNCHVKITSYTMRKRKLLNFFPLIKNRRLQ